MRHPASSWAGAAVLAATATVAALVGAAPAAAAPAAGANGGQPRALASCTAKQLPLPAKWRDVQVVAGDHSGRYQVGDDANIHEPSDNAHAIIWHDGRIAGRVTGDVGLKAVNGHGVAVGYRKDQPAVLVRGAMRYLPGHVSGYAAAINDKGAVAGVRFLDIDRSVAVRWPSTGSKPTVLAPPKGFTVEDVVGIDTDGTVVADVWKGDSRSSVYEVYVWRPHHAGFAIPALRVRGATVDTRAITIGQGRIGIVAEVRIAKKTVTWTHQYDLRKRSYQRVSTVVDTSAMNAKGWVTGWVGGKRQAVVAAKGRSVPLRAPRGFRSAVMSPWTLSDSGRVIGGSMEVARPTTHGRTLPVIWRCH